MQRRREKLAVAAAALLFGVVFGILVLACGQADEQPEARTAAPATSNAKSEVPPARAATKVTDSRESRGFDDFHSHVQDLGMQLEGMRATASGEFEIVLKKLEAEQARLMAELDAIGGQNEKWDAARAELVPKITALREQVRALREKLNG